MSREEEVWPDFIDGFPVQRQVMDAFQHLVDERAALEAEVARLKEKNDRQVVYGQVAADVAEQIVALRKAVGTVLFEASTVPVDSWGFHLITPEAIAALSAAVNAVGVPTEKTNQQ